MDATPAHPRAGDPGRGLRWFLAGIWLGAVAVITLSPGPPPRPWTEEIPTLCLFCGGRGAADAILNVVLFLPLGVLLGHWRGVAAAVLGGALASGAIETTQFFLPGRNPAMGDIVWNATGAAVGALAGMGLRRWLWKEPPRVAKVLAVALPALYLGLAGWMAHPAGTESRYYGQWTADLGFMDHYRGELLAAEIDGVPVPSGPYGLDDPVPDVEREFRLEATVVKGPAPRRIAPVVSVYDGTQQEILVLGAQGDDLIWRLRDRAKALGFDFREVRVPGALGSVSVGDTVEIRASRVGGSLCLGVAETSWCDLGFAPSRTWSYLMNLEGASPAFRALLDTAWMATLFFLVGLLGGSTRSTAVLGLASVGVVVVAVAFTPLVAGGVLQWVGLGTGVAVGIVARPLIRRLLG
ncbi:MAG: VanZ family protein [Gemmatimonadales bacterium]|nr:MAG: VanZ family protein [Gemmatimonadales bacterium]